MRVLLTAYTIPVGSAQVGHGYGNPCLGRPCKVVNGQGDILLHIVPYQVMDRHVVQGGRISGRFTDAEVFDCFGNVLCESVSVLQQLGIVYCRIQGAMSDAPLIPIGRLVQILVEFFVSTVPSEIVIGQFVARFLISQNSR